MTSLFRLLVLCSISAASLAVVGVVASAQGEGAFDDPNAIRAALAKAQRDAIEADERAETLEAEARRATEEAERTAREAAALAARIQQSEAGVAAAEARIALIEDERAELAKTLAERREPLVRLTASLQRMARRPLALSVMRPGTLRDTVYLRAMLETTIPEVRKRTAALRAEIERGRRLEAEARQAVVALRSGEDELSDRQRRLAAIESRQRLESRRASGAAARESERALALAEEARDLDGLIERLDEAGSLRSDLAELPGPVIRPARPERSEVAAATATATASANGAPAAYSLPVTGRTLAGFGEAREGGTRTQGITLSPRGGALVVAPAEGRVAFAGPYRGYGRIVIIEHDGGFTSLVTGLARSDVEVGDDLVGGAPLGVADVENPEVTLELRRDGSPVNPLDFVR